MPQALSRRSPSLVLSEPAESYSHTRSWSCCSLSHCSLNFDDGESHDSSGSINGGWVYQGERPHMIILPAQFFM